MVLSSSFLLGAPRKILGIYCTPYYYFIFNFSHIHIYFPASGQAVVTGGCRPFSSLPGSCFQFLSRTGFGNPTVFSSIFYLQTLLTHALALSGSQFFVHQKNVPTNLYLYLPWDRSVTGLTLVAVEGYDRGGVGGGAHTCTARRVGLAIYVHPFSL